MSSLRRARARGWSRHRSACARRETAASSAFARGDAVRRKEGAATGDRGAAPRDWIAAARTYPAARRRYRARRPDVRSRGPRPRPEIGRGMDLRDALGSLRNIPPDPWPWPPRRARRGVADASRLRTAEARLRSRSLRVEANREHRIHRMNAADRDLRFGRGDARDRLELRFAVELAHADDRV